LTDTSLCIYILKHPHFTHTTRVCSLQFLQHRHLISLQRIKQFIFIMESHRVLCEVRNENLYSISKKLYLFMAPIA